MRRITDYLELAFVIGIVIACHAVKKSDSSILPAFDKQGHRGCRGLMPENTIPAMIKAIDLGVTTLEMDVVITKDKQVLLSHEPFFGHEISSHPNGKPVESSEERKFNIYQLTYNETQQFDVGIKPHPRFLQQQKMQVRKPLLIDVIDSVENYCHIRKLALPFYNIETKSQQITDHLFHPPPEEFVNLVMNVVKQKSIGERVIIQSFDFRTLQVMHAKYPSIKTAALVEDFDKQGLENHLRQLGFIPTIYSPHYSLVTEELVMQCHTQKMKLIPWTVNDKPKIDELRKMGVDGVISDFPDLFSK
ncbi:MAG: glycerophosphodiester phosphodiesterase family protein [Flavisolibacter sp.]